ncbi:MAG: hypothetical protein ACJAZ0_000133 [Halioglobus sp.]|jgi:hypothetical protein
MKTAANSCSATQSKPIEPNPKPQWKGLRYLIVAVIIVTIGLLASMMPEDANALAFQVGPGFLIFWLAGGCTTLILLSLAARKPT